jgi:hypothetical protein
VRTMASAAAGPGSRRRRALVDLAALDADRGRVKQP